MGAIVVIYTVKFLFQKKIVDTHTYTQIQKREHPDLFNVVNEIADKVGTDKPNKIYLSNDVNASVFFNSSLRSLILPTPKNLVIGLGLVNSVNMSEFKAILAHEFGHFSQKSMKVGSYVYIINKVIVDLIYNNNSFNKGVERWSNLSNFFGAFAQLGIGIVNYIRGAFKQIYEMVNLDYLELSRAMEFHADSVAADLFGSNNSESALLKVEFGSLAYEQTFQFYASQGDQKTIPDNFYEHQYLAIKLIADFKKIPLINGFPKVTLEDHTINIQSKLSFINEWDTHPPIQERIRQIRNKRTSKTTDSSSPWTLFSSPEHLKATYTKAMVSEALLLLKPRVFDPEDFERAFSRYYQNNNADPRYNGIFNFIEIEELDLTSLPNNSAQKRSSPPIIGKDAFHVVEELVSLENDHLLLLQVSEKMIDVDYFVYGEKEYEDHESKRLSSELSAKIDQVKNEIREIQIDSFTYFKEKAIEKNQWNAYSQSYENYIKVKTLIQSDKKLYQSITGQLSFMYENTPTNLIVKKLEELNENESRLKQRIKDILTNQTFMADQTEESVAKLKQYLEKSWEYFKGKEYIHENLSLLMNALDVYESYIQTSLIKSKMAFLKTQISLLD